MRPRTDAARGSQRVAATPRPAASSWADAAAASGPCVAAKPSRRRAQICKATMAKRPLIEKALAWATSFNVEEDVGAAAASLLGDQDTT